MNSRQLSFTLKGLSSEFFCSALLQTAASIGIFSAIGSNELSENEISLKINTLPKTKAAVQSLGLILNGLASLNILVKNSNKYTINPLIGNENCLPIVLLKEEILASNLENRVWLDMKSIIQGQSTASLNYQNGLLKGNIKKYAGIQLINGILAYCVIKEFRRDFAEACDVLDLGGGDGIFSDHLLGQHKHLSVDIVDLGDGGSSPARVLKKNKYPNRINVINADARNYTSSKKYDLVVINELLELFPFREKVQIIKTASELLAKGGKLLITKFDLNKDGLKPISSAIFSLRMRMKSNCSYLETNAELIQILRKSGLFLTDYKCLDGIKTIFKAESLNITLPNSLRSSLKFNRIGEPISISTKILLPKMDQLKFEIWTQLMSIANSYRVPAILFASLELKIFEYIGENGSTISDIKKQIGIDDIAIDLIVKALISLGILKLDNSLVYLDLELKELLCPGEESMYNALLTYKKENRLWLDLPEIIKDDSLRANSRREIETNTIGEYLHLVATGNQDSVKTTIEKIKELNIVPRRVADIGGGRGDFSIEICKEFPNVKCTILDLVHVVDYHKSKDYSKQSWFERIKFEQDDLVQEANRDLVDTVIISDMLHYFDRETKIKILNNALAMLGKNGYLVYHKFTLDSEGIEPLSAAILSIRFNTKRPGAYLETDHEATEILNKLSMTHVHTTIMEHGKTLLIYQK